MAPPAKQSATPIAKKANVTEASCSISITEATPLDMVPPVQEIADEPSPAPKTRKPTPKKRKSTKKASTKATPTKTPSPAHDSPALVNPSAEEAPIPQKPIPQGENPQEPAKEVAQTKEKTLKPSKHSRKLSKGESSAQVEQPPA
ncbi:predicted GPI-anchored protein 58 [Cryptomeria japonica]|uniref:predicted GPI-anchored protein 58 n=1 Tax=Cryptomeria japonica TaxID=3369 RepID=UPI0027D9D57B|nr:predicted GPI-anchored protein 58 [Cryptomeria japonica]